MLTRVSIYIVASYIPAQTEPIALDHIEEKEKRTVSISLRFISVSIPGFTTCLAAQGDYITLTYQRAFSVL